MEHSNGSVFIEILSYNQKTLCNRIDNLHIMFDFVYEINVTIKWCYVYLTTNGKEVRPTCQSLCLPTCPSVSLLVSLSPYLSLCLSLCPFFYPSLSLSLQCPFYIGLHTYSYGSVLSNKQTKLILRIAKKSLSLLP